MSTIETHTTRVTVTVNGREVSEEVEPRTLLVHFLREQARLTGTHVGCDTSNCGACTVLIDDEAAKSCTVLAVQANGGFSPVQEGFRQEHGLQCGYCTPGMIMACTALLAENPQPDEHQIREALEGNLCRCTGYETIVRAVQWAATNGGAGEWA